MAKKTCTGCEKTLPLDEFHKNAGKPDGRQSRCKTCRISDNTTWYNANKNDLRRARGYVERSCNRCGETWFRHPKRKGGKCQSCTQELKKVPCPECGGPKSKNASTCRSCMDTTGSKGTNWKGGTSYHSKGYVMVSVPGRGYVAAHVIAMEEHIGRRLEKGENVHHINGIRDDNRIENLELWVRPQPTGIRAKDAVAWAKEILAKYEDLDI